VSLRSPHRVERYFFKFRFLCVFPCLDPNHPEHAAREKAGWFRRPESCVLRLWPERHPSLMEEYEMEPFELDDAAGAGRVNPVADDAIAGLSKGSQDLISNDPRIDPRCDWGPYDTPNFRGFSVVVEVAVGLPYSFNFDMDGRTFLSPAFPVPVDEAATHTWYRRAAFNAACRPYTINPLKVLGVVI
jgi:hypothetical protein